MQTTLAINAVNLLAGLRRIAYTPAEAVCAIVDNAIDAGARNVHILTRNMRGSTPNGQHLIIDDGDGMGEAGIRNALTLGADASHYGPNSFSKFGLGLKSAAFSQGDELDVISSPGGGAPFLKYQVSLPAVERERRYFADTLPLSPDDEDLISRYLPAGKGTIIRVGKVRKEGHPSVKDTIDVLKRRIGIIYYYFLADGDFTISLENVALAPFDVLFAAEADAHGNLEEDTWNGRETRWIQQPLTVPLDIEQLVNATIEVTQMPHPPTFKYDGRGEWARVTNDYLMEAENYGFYVYRNRRLISWAERFSNGFTSIIPNSSKHYGFRGRLNVSGASDTAFNIDVKKSSLTLSDEAWNTLSDLTLNYKRKSLAAWKRAADAVKERSKSGSETIVDELAADLPIPENPPGKEALPDDVLEAENKAIAARMKARVIQEAKAEAAVPDETTPRPPDAPPLTPEQQFEEALKGENNLFASKVFRKKTLQDNQLWEPYFDAQHGYCVRINRLHRFSRLIYDDNAANGDLRILFEMFLHQAAVAEIQFEKRFKTQYPEVKLEYRERFLADFRKDVSEYLANMCRQLEGKLPPTSSSEDV